MSKLSSIDATLTLWCNRIGTVPYDHEGYYQVRQSVPSFQKFIDSAEDYGWKYIDECWHCPACAEAANNE